MNNGILWDSECSSGCESGWTVYLEHESFISHSPPNYPSNIISHHHQKFVPPGKQLQLQQQRVDNDQDEEEDEDMSMVSDASSGPPHFQQHNNYNYNEEPVNVNVNVNVNECKSTSIIRRKKSKDKFLRPTPQHLDDTASSPNHVLFHFSQNNTSTMIHSNQAHDHDFSQDCCYSATHFQGRTSPSSISSSNPDQQLGLGYFQYLPTPTGNQMHQNQWHGS